MSQCQARVEAIPTEGGSAARPSRSVSEIASSIIALHWSRSIIIPVKQVQVTAAIVYVTHRVWKSTSRNMS